MVCSRTPSNLLGVPLRFTEEFEVVIKIAVADRRDGWVGPLPDLRALQAGLVRHEQESRVHRLLCPHLYIP